ncbi:unnamed protein product [Chrysoparadoxa australica]
MKLWLGHLALLAQSDAFMRSAPCVRAPAQRGSRSLVWVKKMATVSPEAAQGQAGSNRDVELGLDDDLREAFSGLCDASGKLGFESFKGFKEVASLLEEDLLMESEVRDIWLAVAGDLGASVGVEGFVQAFNSVDDLFEDEWEGIEEDKASLVEPAVLEGDESSGEAEAGTSEKGGAELLVSSERHQSLAAAFEKLMGSLGALASMDDVLKWKEVSELINEKQLSVAETKSLFDGIAKGGDSLDIDGFVQLGAAIDNLFEYVEDGQAETEAEAEAEAAEPTEEAAKERAAEEEMKEEAAKEVVLVPLEGKTQEERELLEEFDELAGSRTGLLGLNNLLRWPEVQSLVDEGQLKVSEVNGLWENVPKAELDGAYRCTDEFGEGACIDAAGFLAFNAALDGLFFYEDEDEAPLAVAGPSAPTPAPAPSPAMTPLPKPTTATDASPVAAVGRQGRSFEESKVHLMGIVQQESQSCGLGTEPKARQQILQAVEGLLAVAGERNVVSKGNDAVLDALPGTWRLMYTSSKSMEFNQGITGLANTLPGAELQGLLQVLQKEGGLLDAYYEEELIVSGGKELTVTVTGDWEVRQTTSLMTGTSSIALGMNTKRVKYGFIDVIGERWKPLRSMAVLDVVYIDDSIRIMRGQTSTSSIFVLFKE